MYRPHSVSLLICQWKIGLALAVVNSAVPENEVHVFLRDPALNPLEYISRSGIVRSYSSTFKYKNL